MQYPSITSNYSVKSCLLFAFSSSKEHQEENKQRFFHVTLCKPGNVGESEGFFSIATWCLGLADVSNQVLSGNTEALGSFRAE